MHKVRFGGTGLEVSPLCFGTLTIGPAQARLPVNRGAALIREALERGVNFVDTAEVYDTYEYVRKALHGFGGRVVVATKSYESSAQGMKQSLELALRQMGLERVDVFLLHEQESELTIAGHRGALDYLLGAKARGMVGAVGISSHSPRAVAAAAAMGEIDVVHAIVNRDGIGLIEGTMSDMLWALEACARSGKAVYAMKPLGGGHLFRDAAAALGFVRDLPFVHAVAVGMKTVDELEMNLLVMTGKPVPEALVERTRGIPRSLEVEPWCNGCGRCVESCRYGALKLGPEGVRVKRSTCTLCGYCALACRDFCLKIY